MAQIFLMSVNTLFPKKDDYPFIDEFVENIDNETYTNMLKWLIDNDVNFHSEIIKTHGIIIMKDEDAMAFKLRWM